MLYSYTTDEDAVLLSSGVITFAFPLWPWGPPCLEKVKAASAKLTATKAKCRVVKVVMEYHFLRTRLRPMVLTLPQAPLTFYHPLSEGCAANTDGCGPHLRMISKPDT